MSHAKSVSPHKGDSRVDQVHQYDTRRCIELLLFAFASVVVICATLLWARYNDDAEAMAKLARRRPSLFMRLVGVEGLDPHASPPVPPAFHLTVEAEWVSRDYHFCNGGKNSMLQVSYHGMILAWGQVPSFCIDGDGSVNGVATLEAKAEAAVLREEVCGLIQSEQHIVGKAEFEVEGEVEGLGYLHCKAFLLQGNATEQSRVPCQVEYYW